MKKVKLIALSSVVGLGVLFTSCGGSVSTDVALKSEVDSVSYAYGASMYQQGLVKHLVQLGFYTDTATMKASHAIEVASLTDDAKKAEATKAFKTKLDSVVKANDKNIGDFVKGMNEALNASESKAAYNAGLSVGGQMSKQMFPMFVSELYGEGTDVKTHINKSAFVAGFSAASKSGTLAVENPSMFVETKMTAAGEKQKAKYVAELKAQYTEQIAAAEKFLAENQAKDGVVSLPSGLQYKVIKQGNGAKPVGTDFVKVHYKGTLLDGTVFDSSYERKEPSTFRVSGGVIQGWTDILQIMPVGSKYTVYIPAELAYKEQQRGDKITPFSALIFDIELLSIEQQPTPPAQQPGMPIRMK